MLQRNVQLRKGLAVAGDSARKTYPDAAEGLKVLGRDYNYWSQRVSDSSTQMSLAVIAGNWAYYGSIEVLLKSIWALTSIGIIFLSLTLALLASYTLTELHRNAFYNAENDWTVWEGRFKDFQAGLIPKDPWPATKTIDFLGVITRIAKTFLPLAAGLVLILGTVFGGEMTKASSRDTKTLTEGVFLLDINVNQTAENTSSLLSSCQEAVLALDKLSHLPACTPKRQNRVAK